jgi:hypothetical protein
MFHKLSILTILIVLNFACETTKNKQLTEENNGINQKDCLVTITNQTDDFLKNIDELQNYKWNAITKKATIKLANDEVLTITRGGCIHFLVSAEFQLSKSISYENDSTYIFDRVLWISELINDYKYSMLKDAIKSGAYETVTNKHITTLVFTNEILKEKFYAITINAKENTFSISQFLE